MVKKDFFPKNYKKSEKVVIFGDYVFFDLEKEGN